MEELQKTTKVLFLTREKSFFLNRRFTWTK